MKLCDYGCNNEEAWMYYLKSISDQLIKYESTFGV